MMTWDELGVGEEVQRLAYVDALRLMIGQPSEAF